MTGIDSFVSIHNVGDLRRYDSRIYRVGMVSSLRMRLDPVQGTLQKFLSIGSNGKLANEFVTYGEPVNMSPQALLEPVTKESLTEEQRKRADRLKEKIMGAAVAEMPVVKGNKVGTPAGKPAAEAARKAAVAEKQAAKTPVAKKEVQLNDCTCGCGEQVPGYFAQGHDARFKGWMLKIERGKMKPSDLPDSVQAAFKFVKRGDGFVTTKNYKGEAHDGYDTNPPQPKAAKAEKAEPEAAAAAPAVVKSKGKK